MLHLLLIFITVCYIGIAGGDSRSGSFAPKKSSDDFHKGLTARAKHGPKGALTALSFYKSALQQDPSSVEVLDELAEVYGEL